MPILDLFKRLVPKVGATPAESDGPRNIQTVMEDFSATTHATIPVDGEAEASQIASGADSRSFPLFAWFGNQQLLKVKQDQLTPWEVIAGRQHGLRTVIGHSSHGPGVLRAVNHTSISRASEGWMISANSQIVTAPVEGLYLLSVRARVGDKAIRLGRTFIEFVVDGVTHRVGAPNDNHVSATVVVWLEESSRIETKIYHEEESGPVSITGEFTAVQLINPRWEIVG